jgi:hypothetical protein
VQHLLLTQEAPRNEGSSKMTLIQGRYTPWDSSSLGVQTYEILSINYTDDNKSLCIEELQSNDFCNARLIYGRFPANDLEVKDILLNSGYIPCEISFRVVLPKLQDYVLPKLFLRRLVDVALVDREKLSAISHIARNMFEFSRFHEDPFIQKELADKRIFQWVNDMVNQEVSTLVSRNKVGDILSFMIFAVNEKMEVELILGGSKKEYRLHSPFFWGSVITYLKESGYNKISTTISAANSGVLSLYQNLEFRIANTNIDYHKHI